MSGLSTYERFALIESRIEGFSISTHATLWDMVMATVETGAFGEVLVGRRGVYGSDDHLKAVQSLRHKLAGIESAILEHRADILGNGDQGGS